MESFPYFECDDRSELVVTMVFNQLEKWDNDDAYDDPDSTFRHVVERWWNSAMYFQWDTEREVFMIAKFTYDDPLTDRE